MKRGLLCAFLFLAGGVMASCATPVRAKESKRSPAAMSVDLRLNQQNSPFISQTMLPNAEPFYVAADASNLPSGYDKVVYAVGRLLSKPCTVEYIGKGLVLTAGHCFADHYYNRTLSMDCPPHAFVAWGQFKDKLPYLVSECEAIVDAAWTDSMDYAVFRLRNPPQYQFAVNFDHKPLVGAEIAILSHPKGGDMQWSKNCGFRPPSDGVSESDFPAGMPDLSGRFAYQCPTDEGSSGGPVVDARTLALVGIHNAGGKPRIVDGKIVIWNFGTLIASTPAKSVFVLVPPEPATPRQRPQQQRGCFPLP